MIRFVLSVAFSSNIQSLNSDIYFTFVIELRKNLDYMSMLLKSDQ